MRPRRFLTTGLLLGVLAGAIPVRAVVSLELGVQGAVGYNSNVFGSSEDELDDFVGRIGPDIRLVDVDGSLRWELRYRPEYQAYVDFSDLDDWDHDVLGKLDWDVGSRTSLGLSTRYLDVSSNSLLSEDVLLPDGTLDTDLAFRVGRFQRLVMDGRLDHQLTERSSILLLLGFFDTTSTVGTQSDQRTSTVTVSYQYKLTPLDTVGAFVRYNRQVVDLDQDDTRTDFYNVSLQWRRSLSPTLFFNVSAGPALVDSKNEDVDISIPGQPLYPLRLGEDGFSKNVRASTCPTLSSGVAFIDASCELFPFIIPSTIGQTTDLALVGELFEPSSNELTYFASVALEKRWQKASASLRYVRDTDNTSSALAVRGSVRDAVTGVFHWKAGSSWIFDVTASWQRTEAAGEGIQFVRAVTGETVDGVPDVARAIGVGGLKVDTKSTIDRYTLSGVLTYQFNPRTDVYLRTVYTREDSKARNFSQVIDRLFVFVGFRHHFTPILLPI